MKYFKSSLVLMLALLMIPLSGCADQTSESSSSQLSSESESSTISSAVSSEASSEVSEEESTAEESDTVESSVEETAFSYSNAFDDNGYWQGIVALDYMELPEYEGISIPSETHEISDDAVQEQVDAIRANYPKQITDRAIADGDSVNIDYTGSIDGVEFDGGSSTGAKVIIGETNFIDDFIEQLIGHTPGETFNVEVTFPDEYSQAEELQGKDAVFVTTINYIYDESEADDAYVADYLSEAYGWTTVSEMTESIREDLKETAVKNYIAQYLLDNTTVESVPEQLQEYFEGSMINYYQGYADAYGVGLDEIIAANTDYSTADEMIEAYAETNADQAKYYLILQAIAEAQDIVPADADVEELYGDNYSDYLSSYGMPSLKHNTLSQQVMQLLTDSAVLA